MPQSSSRKVFCSQTEAAGDTQKARFKIFAWIGKNSSQLFIIFKGDCFEEKKILIDEYINTFYDFKFFSI